LPGFRLEEPHATRDEFRHARESAASVQIPGMGESAVSDNEADEMEEHLRGLGYIE
jgi:hypothetical protein